MVTIMEGKKSIAGHSTEDIQLKLDKKLGPEYISKRVGYGSSRVAYIEGWRVINLANQIFGYDGWSTEVKSVTIDFLDERQGKFCIGCTAIVRVTLSVGGYREDIGYGTVENERRKSAAFERAKKSAVTDALKRSLRGFGNALGNCLYDKDFLSRIDKVKFDPPDFDEGNLFRPSDEITDSSRSNTVDTSEVRQNKRRQITKVGNSIKTTTAIGNEAQPTEEIQINRNDSQPGNKVDTDHMDVDTVTKQEPDELLDDSLMFSDDFQDDDIINMERKDQPRPVEKKAPHVNDTSTPENAMEPITFVTARAASSLQNKIPVTHESVFDPKYQAQSIKHTVDQTTSKHVPTTVFKEKGINDSRDTLYEKFAPKGKEIGLASPTLTSDAKEVAPGSSTPSASPPSVPSPAFPRFAPPTTAYTNGSASISTVLKPARREVGRPKLGPVYQRRANP